MRPRFFVPWWRFLWPHWAGSGLHVLRQEQDPLRQIQLEGLPDAAFPDLLLRQGRAVAAESRVVRRKCLRRARPTPQFPGQEPDSAHRYATMRSSSRPTSVEFIPEGVGAFAVPSRNRMVLRLTFRRATPEADPAELTHVFQFEILYQGRLGKALSSRRRSGSWRGWPPTWATTRTPAPGRSCGTRSPPTAFVGERQCLRLLRVPLRPHGVPVRRVRMGRGGVTRLRFRVPQHLGGGMQKSIKRAFDLDVEEFDSRFPCWLRKYYQPLIADRSDPREFGPAFRAPEGTPPYETSPVASPSGDILAAFSTTRKSGRRPARRPNRSLFRNLTPGGPLVTSTWSRRC